MYIGGASIFQLESFINGYVMARSELNMPSTDRENDFFENFHNWLQERLDARTTKSWSSIILFRSFNERDALKRFFPLWEEFRNRGDRSLAEEIEAIAADRGIREERTKNLV
ncbi:MAG: hypothetical protein F6J93_14555 [Oscillatoria sp. SIO1A7]|nr:hypothetical protein [Oscillatoria sp. SIO1A7]